MPTPSLREKLKHGEFFFAPGIQDMITAVIAREIGFDAFYATGFWLTASAYGLPDAGIATYSQMVDRVQTLVRCAGDTPVIADADTGYGGLLNVRHTVRGYESAGAAAIQIEDQEFPKKCGHTPFKRVVPTAVMVAKIRVAIEARENPDTLIIARTDARQSEGLAGTLRRSEAYARAGADIVFPEALTSEDEMRQVCAAIDAPLMANMADGGLTPVLSATVLKELGFSCAIFPSLASLASAAAARHALLRLKETGASRNADVPLYDFDAFCRLIGFEAVWDFERRWADVDAAATPSD
jgi:2-methylisocitrate lyase-like PEP mutase family enzyme